MQKYAPNAMELASRDVVLPIGGRPEIEEGRGASKARCFWKCATGRRILERAPRLA